MHILGQWIPLRSETVKRATGVRIRQSVTAYWSRCRHLQPTVTRSVEIDNAGLPVAANTHIPNLTTLYSNRIEVLIGYPH